jgi:hypothetical protein
VIGGAPFKHTRLGEPANSSATVCNGPFLKLASGDLDAVYWKEDFDGNWTCSGCGREWAVEAETPEANNFHYCPGCGGRITSFFPYEDGVVEDESDE